MGNIFGRWVGTDPEAAVRIPAAEKRNSASLSTSWGSVRASWKPEPRLLSRLAKLSVGRRFLPLPTTPLRSRLPTPPHRSHDASPCMSLTHRLCRPAPTPTLFRCRESTTASWESSVQTNNSPSNAPQHASPAVRLRRLPPLRYRRPLTRARPHLGRPNRGRSRAQEGWVPAQTVDRRDHVHFRGADALRPLVLRQARDAALRWDPSVSPGRRADAFTLQLTCGVAVHEITNWRRELDNSSDIPRVLPTCAAAARWRGCWT